MTDGAAAPAPAPPEARLVYFEGDWTYRLKMAAGPFGPGGEVEGTEHDEILPGGFQLLRRYDTRGPFGRLQGVEILGWDAELGSYFQRGFDSAGRTHLYRGSVAGDTWTWTFEATAAGKDYRARITIREVSENERSYLSEISEDGDRWTAVLEGTFTRRDTGSRRRKAASARRVARAPRRSGGPRRR